RGPRNQPHRVRHQQQASQHHRVGVIGRSMATTTTRSFVHLHNHSQYSLLDGASKLDDLLEKAAEFGMPAMAVADHGNIFGAVRFFDSALERGIRPILGMEAYVAPGDRRDRTTQAGGTQGAQKKPYYHQILLATNATGYANLVRLSSIAYTEGFYYKP